MAMEKLSVELRSILSSSLQINSFKRVVEELVYNSLDAKSTSIAVRINIAENKIQVVDNGCGITENNFDLIGQKYCSSKCVDLNTLKSVPNTYGFRGQFLANLISIAQKVKITSRCHKNKDTWVKIFYDGKERDLAKTTTRPSIGTTIEVSHIFYNLHIQSKNLDSLNELNEIKILLKQLSLIHSSISISLRNDSQNEIIFKAHKNRDVYQTFRMLFNVDEKDIQEFKVEKKEYKVTAYLAKKDKDIGQYHWIYLNGKFINNCKLHKIVNDALSKSLRPLLKRKLKTKVDANEDVITERNLPFYILLLACPYYDYDISNSSKHATIEFKNWQDISNLLKKLVLFYTGDEKFNNQLKCEKATKHDIKSKVAEDDTRDQVRKIVEKLLKSNSKKLGVSQMQNGIKGKLTKRKKKSKHHSLKLSLSKVIPSKNKLIRHLSKDNSKQTTSKEEVIYDLEPEVKLVEYLEKENEQIEGYLHKQYQTVPNRTSDIKISCIRKRKLEKLKHPTTIINRNDRRKDVLIGRKKKNTRSNRTIGNYTSVQNNNDIHIDKGRHQDDKNKMGNYSSNDFIESVNLNNFKNESNRELNLSRNNHVKADLYSCYNEKGNPLNKNGITTICNYSNSNSKITLRKQVEEIIVYDYIPHKLNYDQCFDLYGSRFKKKSYISSRDLVQTILSSQHVSGEDEFKAQRLEILTNNNNIFATSPEVKRDNIVKNARDSTFDAWNFNFQSDPHSTNKLNDEGMLVTRLTYESHHYNKNTFNDKTHTSQIKRTKQFITKQSKDNFLLSMKKQKNNLHSNKFPLPERRYLFRPKLTKNHDFNFSVGIKNFLKTNHFIPGSSLTIEFPSSTENKISHETKCNQIDENILGGKDNFITNANTWSLNSDINEAIIHENSDNISHKNTYTVNETSLDVTYNCNILKQNEECITNTNDLMHETYTIQTNNESSFINCINYNDEENKKDKSIEKHADFNIVFVSEPQVEVSESPSDKMVEPLNICETVFNDSHSDNTSNASQMDNTINEINSDIFKLADKHKSPKIPVQEVSHHFNTTINNTNNIPVTNYYQISNKDTSSIGNNEIILRENSLLNQNIPKSSIVNNYGMKNRPRFMPKGMSQIFENCNTKGVCDYDLNEEYFKHNVYEDFTNEVQMNTEVFKPRVQTATSSNPQAIEKVHTKLHKENTSLIFDGKLLKQAQVLGQIDDKFIVAVIKAKSEYSNFLVLFDQHAVHERIRLEKNMAEYFNQQEWKSVKPDDFLLKLSKDEILYLNNHKEKFNKLGLEWNILSDGEVAVFGIPGAILGKNPRQVDKIIAAVKNLIVEEIRTIKSQGGCISLYPKSIMDLVFSEACRYAIKFGDKLTITDCKELIQSLSECKTPFQCAHGRPVMAVLMEMSSHHVCDYKADISKIRFFLVNK